MRAGPLRPARLRAPRLLGDLSPAAQAALRDAGRELMARRADGRWTRLLRMHVGAGHAHADVVALAQLGLLRLRPGGVAEITAARLADLSCRRRAALTAALDRRPT